VSKRAIIFNKKWRKAPVYGIIKYINTTGEKIMPYIRGQNRYQTNLLPNTIDDYVKGDNPVRVIDMFVNKLDMATLGFKKEPAKEGRPGYDPVDLLKLYIYGYFNKIRSSRKLEKETTRNLELIWLLEGIVPDFRCIADFRKNNPAAIKKVFKEFVQKCKEFELLSEELIATDGSKFRAWNSNKNCYTHKSLEKNIKRIEEKLNEYLEELDRNDVMEEKEFKRSKEDIVEYMEKLDEQKEKYKKILDELNKSGENQIATTDPESRLMKTQKGFEVCYNVQTSVEAKNHIVIDCEVTNAVTDANLLTENVNRAKEALGVETIESVADKGYRDDDEILNCLLNGDTPNVYTHEKQDCYTFEFKKNNDIEVTAEMAASKDKETIKKCIEAGVLPKILQNKRVKLEIKEEAAKEMCILEETGEIVEKKGIFKQVIEERTSPISEYFTRDLDTDTVICPMGQTLYHYCKKNKDRPDKKQTSVYYNRKVCASCRNKCSCNKYRVVTFKEGEIKKKTDFYERCLNGQKVWKIRRNYSKTIVKEQKVILRFYPDYEKLKLRKQTVEHPYGTVKRWNDGSYTLLKGKLKVSADIALMFLAYNMKRVINILGIRKLIELMNV